MGKSAGKSGDGINLSQLKLDGVIFHLVPERPTDPKLAEESGPSYSDAEQALPAKLAQYLRDQIVSTFTRSRQPATPDEEADSPLPAGVIGFLDHPGPDEDAEKNFVDFSKLAARLLYESQRANSPDGLLVVARGTVGAKAVVCVAKLEQQSGLSFEVKSEGDTQLVTVNMEDGLVLTDETAVFKAAVFRLVGSKASRSLDVVVSDEQSGKVYQAPITNYWLRAFLGCRYANGADVQTRAFVKAVSKIVNADLADIALRDQLQSALNVELLSNNGSIDPKAFVESHVPPDTQDQAMKRMRDEGVPTTAFPKGQDVVDHAPKNTWYEYKDGTRVKVPLDHQVEISRETTDHGDVLTVRGSIDRIR